MHPEVRRGECTLGIGPEIGRDTDAAEPLAPKAHAAEPLPPKALAAERLWEGSESRVPDSQPEWGQVAGSPGPAQPRPRYAFPAPYAMEKMPERR